ncbi:MAG: hypothetical protein AAGJ18_01710 [Bacteroidota bacterium]
MSAISYTNLPKQQAFPYLMEQIALPFDFAVPAIRQKVQKVEKSQLIYRYFKDALYDVANYQKIDNPARFTSALDRYFKSLEWKYKANHFEKLSVLQQSFGIVDKVVTDDAIFGKIFPFNQIKIELKTELSIAFTTLCKLVQ